MIRSFDLHKNSPSPKQQYLLHFICTYKYPHQSTLSSTSHHFALESLISHVALNPLSAPRPRQTPSLTLAHAPNSQPHFSRGLIIVSQAIYRAAPGQSATVASKVGAQKLGFAKRSWVRFFYLHAAQRDK